MDLLVPAKVSVNDQAKITWEDASNGTLVKTFQQDELIFILRSSASSDTPYYVVCLLSRDAVDAKDQIRPTLLRVETVPDELLADNLVEELPSQLYSHPKNQVDVLVSVKSGTDLALPFWENVLRPLLDVAYSSLKTSPAADAGRGVSSPPRPPHVVVTKDENTIRRYAEALSTTSSSAEGKSRTIILLSGDGGIVDLLNGLEQALQSHGNAQEPEPKPIIAVIPLGTGNALFHSLLGPRRGETSSPLIAALRTLFRGKAADLPTFRVSFSPGACITSFRPQSAHPGGDESGTPQLVKHQTPVDYLIGAVVASYGFHASVVYESDTPEYRVHGSARFGMVAQELLRESHAYAATVDVRRPLHDEPGMTSIPRDSHAYVLSTPISNLESNFCISPDSRPLDGKLRLVHFGDIGGDRTMKAMMAAYDGGKHVGMKWDDGHEVGYEEVEELLVGVLEENERWRKACVDGTIVDIPKGGHMFVAMEKDGNFKVLVDPRIIE